MDKKQNQTTPIERKLLKIAAILAVSVTAFWLVFGVIVGYQWPVMTIYGIGFIFYSFVLWKVLKGSFHPVLVNAYFYFGAAFLALGWFPSGGITGAVIHLFILLYFAGLLTLAPRSYLVFVSIMVLIVITFTFVELRYPDLAAPYLDERQRITDIAIGEILTMIISGLAVFSFKIEYLKDQVRIRKLNRFLQEEKVKAETADKTKSQFLTTISHEMRTPLSGIVGITDLLNKTELNEEQKQLVANLSNSSSLLHSLISDVLDLSEIESGKLVLHKSSFDLKKEILKVLDIFKTSLKGMEKHIELVYHHDESIEFGVNGDLLRFKQVLINLINNAVKFTDEGQVSVSTVAMKSADQEVEIQVDIQDTGPGIPEKIQHELFQKFVKFHDTSTPDSPGTGLGLAISKNLVELMGGEIWFVSERGAGSTFSFKIPFEKVHEKGLDIHEAGVSPKNDFSNLDVLLVEDVQINQMVIRKMLSNLHIKKVDLAEDGLKGLERAKDKHYDLILMDVLMPEMDGIEATELILKHFVEIDKPPPIIFALTANATKEDIDLCLSVGMDHFISKPFTQEELVQGLRKFL